MSGVYVCSLANKIGPQEIPADGRYHLLRFPFGKRESYDRYEMHQVKQPDGYHVTDWAQDDRSGLIWPCVDGWGTLTSMILWEDGIYTLTKDRFVRDPLGINGDPDSTATQTHPHPLIPGVPDFPELPFPWAGKKEPDGLDGLLSTGPQYVHGTHQIFVHPGVPLGVMVTHNSPTPLTVTLAEFKLAIQPTAAQGSSLLAQDAGFPEASLNPFELTSEG